MELAVRGAVAPATVERARSWLQEAERRLPITQCTLREGYAGTPELSFTLAGVLGLILEAHGESPRQEARLAEVCPACYRMAFYVEDRCKACGRAVAPEHQVVRPQRCFYLGHANVATKPATLRFLLEELSERMGELRVEPLTAALIEASLLDCLQEAVEGVLGFSPAP